MEQPDFKKIAAQLRNPQGEDGLVTARRMEDNNAFMIRSCIDSLPIRENSRILEIGPGGGGHLPYLLSKAAKMQYTGADISETMIRQASEANQAAVAAGTMTFTQVHAEDGKVIFPYEPGVFDIIFTVNTLYFWDDAPGQAAELYRILKPGGRLAICFSTEDFMKTLPFTQYNFRLYTTGEARQLMEEAGFRVLDLTEHTETLTGHEGKPLERAFAILHVSR